MQHITAGFQKKNLLQEHRKRERTLARAAARAVSMSANDNDGNGRVTWSQVHGSTGKMVRKSYEILHV